MSKGTGGLYVVGATRNVNSMAEIKLLLHEIESFQLCHRQPPHEPHRMPSPACAEQNTLYQIQHIMAKLLYFVLEHQNPYSVMVNVPVPLHNLFTTQAVDQKVTARLLKYSTTSKCKLPFFKDQIEKTPTTILTKK